jgi:uncharacterized protein YjcR
MDSDDKAREGLRTLMAAGMSLRAIAAVYRCSPTTILRRWQQMDGYAPDADGRITVHRTQGLDRKVRPNRRFDTTERDRVIRGMRHDGLTMRAIAETVGCSVGTVHRVFGVKII